MAGVEVHPVRILGLEAGGLEDLDRILGKVEGPLLRDRREGDEQQEQEDAWGHGGMGGP